MPLDTVEACTHGTDDTPAVRLDDRKDLLHLQSTRPLNRSHFDVAPSVCLNHRLRFTGISYRLPLLKRINMIWAVPFRGHVSLTHYRDPQNSCLASY
jgi:hypothetical protein